MDDREKRDGEELFSATTQLKKKHKEGKPGSKRWITLVATGVLVGLAVGALYLSGIIVPPEPETPQTTDPVTDSYLLLDKEKADFVSASIQTATENYTIVRSGEAYAVKDMGQFTLDQTKAGNLVTSCTYLYVSDIAESADDLSVYGLDNPLARVTAAYADGSSKVFLLGSQAPSGYRYYMKLADSPKIYTVFSSTGDRFTATLQSLHVMPALTVASDAIRNVTLTRPDGQVVEVGYSSEASLGISGIRLKQPFAYEADSEKLQALFDGIAGIQLKAFEADAAEGTLSIYGLDMPRYILNVTGNGTDAAGTAVDDATLMTLWIGKDKGSDQTYVRLDTSNKVFTVDRNTLSFLNNATASNLVDRFANIINIQKVDAIQVKGDGTDVKLDITRTPELDENGNQKTNANGQPQYIEDFTINGVFCDGTVFRKLYQIIIGTRVDGLIPEDNIPAEDTAPVLTVRYQLNEVRDEEVVEYLPYDADHYAVRRNGICLFYIEKARVNQIPKALEEVQAGTFVAANYGV